MLPSRILLAILITGDALSACAPRASPSPPPPLVIVAQPLQRQVEDWDDFVGQFEAVDNVQVRPRVSGYVQSLGFRDGQGVRKGQLLVQIDPRPYQAILDQATAQTAHASAALADAKVELDRARALLGARATSQQDYDTRLATEHTAEADLRSAQATQRTAALNLSFTRVVAPVSGRASDARATPGNLVTQDVTVLTTIVSQDPIRFRFTGAESLFLKYQREGLAAAGATPVRIRLQDEADYRWPGRLAFVDNAYDPSSGVISAYALVDNPSNVLTPGMFGHMKLLGSRPYPGLLIPDQAVVTDQSRQVVYVVGARNLIAQRMVALGPLADGLRVVRSGLDPGDRVVIDGVQWVRPGRPVTPRPGRIEARPGGPTPTPDTAPPPDSATFAPGP